VIAATSDSEINIGVYEDASKRTMLVNVVDVPPLCNFHPAGDRPQRAVWRSRSRLRAPRRRSPSG